MLAYKTKRIYRPGLKKYIISMISAGVIISALIVGGVGSVMQTTLARDNNRGRSDNYSNQNRGNSRNDQSGNRDSDNQGSQKTQSNKSDSSRTTPPITRTQKTRTPMAQTTTSQPQQVVTPQIVAPPAPKLVDTSPQIAQMVAAQADKDIASVAYKNGQMSETVRNWIFVGAGAATGIGAVLYTMSFFSAGLFASKRDVPIRYIVPVREVSAS